MDPFSVDKSKEKQKKAKEIAARYYEDEISALEDDFAGKLEASLSEVPGTVENIGKDAMQGFIDGMDSKMFSATAKAREIAAAVIRAYQDAFDINSPSKKMKKMVGKPIGEGIHLGAQEELQKMYAKMKASVDYETAKLGGSIAAAANFSAENSKVTNTKEYYTTSKTVEKTTKLEFVGNLSALGRMLRPVIVDEGNRVGTSLVKGT